MNFFKIPTEIFVEILCHVYKRDVMSCALVCKSWNVHAIQFLYKKLSLNAYRVYLAKQQLKMNANERNNYFKYGSLVKTLVIKYDEKDALEYRCPKGFDIDSIQDIDCEFDKDDLILLLEYLPNIKNLDIGSSTHATKYFQYILDTKSNKCLNHVQVISPAQHDLPFYYTSNPVDTHFLVCYKYCTSITTLVVNYDHIMIDVGSEHDRMLTFLSHFTSLIDLTLNNTCDAHLTIFDIQRIFSHLVSLNYSSDRNIPDEIVKNILIDSADRSLNSNLKSLELIVPTVPVNYARYITDYLSTQLDTLKLNIGRVDLYDWIDDIGMDNALKLANSLSTVKNTWIKWTPYKGYKRKSTSNESNVTIFFKLLHAFKGNKKTYCHGHYSDFRRVHHSMYYDLNGGLRFNYGLDYADYYLRTEQDSEHNMDGEHQSQRVAEISLPDTVSSIIGPEVINHMDIIICDSNPELSFKFLKYALVHCPNLQCFEFKSMIRPRQDICISTDINYYKARGDHHIISKSTQENLKVIKTADFIPSKKMLNLISTHLPNIELFACGTRGYGMETLMTTDMDVTAFENLETFYFDVEIMPEDEIDHKFIHIKYSDGDEVYCCQDDTEDPVVLNPATLEFFEECNSNEKLLTFTITIKCNKEVKLIVCCDKYFILGEFDNGKLLDYINTDYRPFGKRVFI